MWLERVPPNPGSRGGGHCFGTFPFSISKPFPSGAGSVSFDFFLGARVCFPATAPSTWLCSELLLSVLTKPSRKLTKGQSINVLQSDTVKGFARKKVDGLRDRPPPQETSSNPHTGQCIMCEFSMPQENPQLLAPDDGSELANEDDVDARMLAPTLPANFQASSMIPPNGVLWAG